MMQAPPAPPPVGSWPQPDYWGQQWPDVVPMPEEPGTIDVHDRAYGPQVGGYAGREIEVHESPVHWGESEAGAWSDGWWPEPTLDMWPDYSVGGSTGSPTETPYSFGPVNSEVVEHFDMTGRILVPGRNPEYAPGPVGNMAYRSDLIMQIVQAMGPEVTDEMQAIGLLSGI